MRTLTEIAEITAKPVPLHQQIDEVEREIRLRCEVYPRWVMQRKLRQGEADEHLKRMRAVLATLKELQGGKQ
jgi:hypothetical protein